MFQNNNTAREIFYIFVWLIGIILFYALVHAFLLEPSSGKSQHVKTTNIHAVDTTDKKETKVEHTKTVTHEVIKTKIKSLMKPVRVPNDNIKVAKPTSIKHIEIPEVKVEMPVTSVLTVPVVPKVPTISTPVTPIKPPQVKQPISTDNQTQKVLEVAKENATPTVKTTYNRDERMQLLETVREDILEQAEKARESTMKGLRPLSK